jgi:hypothetical protein
MQEHDAEEFDSTAKHDSDEDETAAEPEGVPPPAGVPPPGLKPNELIAWRQANPEPPPEPAEEAE